MVQPWQCTAAAVRFQSEVRLFPDASADVTFRTAHLLMYEWTLQREYLKQSRLVFQFLLPESEPVRFVALAFPVSDVIMIFHAVW